MTTQHQRNKYHVKEEYWIPAKEGMETILKSMKITPQARSAALKVLKENSK